MNFKSEHPYMTNSRSNGRFKSRFSKYSVTQKIRTMKRNYGKGSIF